MKKGVSLISIISIILLWGLLGCATAPPKTSYLARVNQDLITLEDLRAEFKRKHGGHGAFLASEVEIRRFLDKMVDAKLLNQEAYRLDFQEDPEIQMVTNEFQGQRLTEYLIKKEVEEKSKVTEEEIKAIYEQKMEERFQVQQIVVKSKEEAEAVLKRIQSGEDFEAIAREESIAPSKKYGGRLPPFGWGIMDSERERIAFGLSPEEVSPIFKGRMGYEIIRLESKETATKPEFDKVKNQIKSILEGRKRDERWKEYILSLRNKYNVLLVNSNLTIEILKKALEQKKDESLATWDGGNISLYPFASKLNLHAISALPLDQREGQIKGILEEVINEKLLQKEALARGYEKVPEIAEKVRHYREGLMGNKLHKDYILADIQVTEEDLRQYFEQNRTDFAFPEKRKVGHILVVSLDSAKEVLKKFKQGESFDVLAKSFSKDSQTSERGGEVGWIGKGEVLPPIEKAAFSLKAGEVSDPVKTDLGYHIIKVLEIQPARLKDFFQAKKEIERKVLQKKREEKIKFWLNKLKAVSDIEINDDGIQASVKKLEKELSEKVDKQVDKGKNKK